MGESIEFDAAIIGGGVVGLAIASEICEIYDNVIVIEKESDFGQHVSSRHSGVIHSGIYYKPDSLKAKLCVEGNKLLYDFARSRDIDYLNCGKLVVRETTGDDTVFVLMSCDVISRDAVSSAPEGVSSHWCGFVRLILCDFCVCVCVWFFCIQSMMRTRLQENGGKLVVKECDDSVIKW